MEKFKAFGASKTIPLFLKEENALYLLRDKA